MLQKKHISIATITQLRSLELLTAKTSTAYVIVYELIDTWFLDSNRRVGVRSLPWHWHIPLTTGRGAGAETCGLDDGFPPDDFVPVQKLCDDIYVYPFSTWVLLYIYIYIYIYTYTYTYMSVIQFWISCTRSHSIGLYFWAVRGSWVERHFLFFWFTKCVLLFDVNSLILGCLWLLAFVLNNTLIQGIWCSTIPHLPECFCPWTFFQNIGFNMVPSESFMSHLATQLGYSAGAFQALQLTVLAAFGVVD